MHNACTIFAWPNLKCHVPLTHSSPSPTEVSPRDPCLKKVENLQQLPIFFSWRQQRKMHTLRSSTYSYSRWVRCVCMCRHVSSCACVYMHGVCEQCCSLCSNSTLFKEYNEKFRDANYVTVFEKNTCQHGNVEGTLLKPDSRSTKQVWWRGTRIGDFVQIYLPLANLTSAGVALDHFQIVQTACSAC